MAALSPGLSPPAVMIPMRLGMGEGFMIYDLRFMICGTPKLFLNHKS
jgi:hypothetical protein